MMILVVGATGDLGTRVVRHLLSGGHSVKALVRRGADVDGLHSLGVRTLQGDLADPGSLGGVCDDAGVVIATATVIGRRLAGARRPSIRDVDDRGMTALVGEAERAGVGRFVYLSFAGLETSFGTPMERAKLSVERRLVASSMPAVIVRPDGFHEIHLTKLGRFDIERGTVAIIGRGDNRRRWVGTEDVAALVAAVATEVDPPAIVEFGGPEALSKNECVAIAEEALGRDITIRHMPRSIARLAARVLARLHDGLASVLGLALHQDLVPAQWDDAPLRQRGITPTSTSEFIQDQARTKGR